MSGPWGAEVFSGQFLATKPVLEAEIECISIQQPVWSKRLGQFFVQPCSREQHGWKDQSKMGWYFEVYQLPVGEHW